MSTYAYAKLFVTDENNKVIKQSKDICVNYMKELLLGSDWPDDFEGFDPKVNIDITIDDIGYIKSSLIKDPNVAKHIIGESKKEPVVVDDMFDTSLYRKDGIIVSNVLDDTSLLAGEWKRLQRKNSNYSIVWLTIGILSSYEEKLQAKLEKSYEELAKKRAIKDSVDYYKLDDDAKESLNEDISGVNDSIEYELSQMKSVNQLIGLMDGYKDANEKNWSDNVYAALFLC